MIYPAREGVMSYRGVIAFVVGVSALGPLAWACVEDVPADRKEAIKQEMKRLESIWRVTEVEVGGKKLPREEIGPKNFLIFSGDKCTTVTGTRRIECTFTVDPARQPKGIDLTRNSDNVRWLGIYELKGDTLKVYLGNKDKRPAKFKTKEGTKQVIHVHQRVKR
jgi:uncharacterized protein (TIGR03067 family)